METRRFAAERYAGTRRRVFVNELGPFISEATKELREQHKSHGPAFAIFHGKVDDENDGPVEVGVFAETGQQLLEQGEAAVTRISGEQRAFPAILEAFATLSTWADANSRVFSARPREVYLTDDVWEVVWPLMPEQD